MTDIEIKYDNGMMVIHLEEFLSCRSLGKVKKLLKIIQQSYTPELADQIQQHIRDRVSGIDGLVKISANQVVIFSERVKQSEHDLNVWKWRRDQHGKNSAPYKYCNDKLKVSRETLKIEQSALRAVKREFNNHVKDKAFFEELLSEVFKNG